MEPKKAKILVVDDEEAILSAARRLLRSKDIDCLTASTPSEALKTLKSEDCWVVVSDYKMPEMSGTKLLAEIKRLYPHMSRLMLTGYLELPIIQDAINQASVFRFITKPWDETELILGIEKAIQHSGRKRTNSKLAAEIKSQNKRLEELTENLESEVVLRTRGIEESRKLAEAKQKQVRELTSFVKDLSVTSEVSQLYETLYFEFIKFQGVSAPFLLLLEESRAGRLYWFQHETLHEKRILSLPEDIGRLGLRTSSRQDKAWWVEATGRECRQLISVPVRARDNELGAPVAILFIEHDLQRDNLLDFMERITERLQPVSIVMDKILLQKQMEFAAKQWEATFDDFKDPIAIIDSRDRVIRANKRFLHKDKTHCYEMLDQRQEPCLGCPMPQALSDLAQSSGHIKTSAQKTYRVLSYPVVGFAGREVDRVVNHYNETSHERDLYLKLVQSEKLAAVGLLAGNIAHELNNPLSGIRGLAQLLKSEVGPTDQHYSDVEEIEKAAGRCQEIIRNLLHFSESSSDEEEPAQMNDLVQATLPLLKTVLRNHNLQTFYGEGLDSVKVKAGEIQQVIFNLINNACQAMAYGGRLIIKTWQQGRRVYCSVSDSGTGIPKEIQERIFEPFFTTKSVGTGTGLGLSVSRNIVEKFGGRLTLGSSGGEGSTFTIELPALVRQLRKAHESSNRR